MKRVLTAGEMREIDRRTIEEVGIPGMVLMENAGAGTAAWIMALLEAHYSCTVNIFCGRGNNGGDGFVIARHLANHGFRAHVLIAGDPATIKGDAKTNLDIVLSMQIPVTRIDSKSDLKKIKPCHFVVDALLGTGIKGAVTGLTGDVIAWINVQEAPVLSVDIPSGLMCDTGLYEGVCIQADYTATMAELKRGLLLYPGKSMAGEVRVMDISAPPEVGASLDLKTFVLEKSDIREKLSARPPEAHKGDFGKVFLLAGSSGLTGAATLAAQGCQASGSGLVVLGAPECVNAILEEKLTEVMTRPLPQTTTGCLSTDALPEIQEMAQWADVLGIGPGLGSDPETQSLVCNIVRQLKKPFVIDADGLNALAEEPSVIKKIKAPHVMTPHPGELSRLTGISIRDIEKDRIGTVRKIARSWDAVLVLKGAPTVIASPEGVVYLNPTGNSGMATGGTGDVLTGIITGLLGQNLSPLHAAICGVYLHGLAGDLAVCEKSSRTLIASDLVSFLSDAFKHVGCAC